MDGHLAATAWVDVCDFDLLPRQGARIVGTARGDVALFRTVDDAVFALDDRCPHKKGVLSQGIVHGHNVTCPLHNWVISLETGEAQAPDSGCTRTIPVRVEDGRVLLGLGG